METSAMGDTDRALEDHESREIIRLIIMIAHSVGLKVVAEGPETKHQNLRSEELGCEMAQGHFYSPPVNAKGALGLLAAGDPAIVRS
jgi:EAL domain-containing protein (putative c-di-GMP-specific phosphodiesterase class I)